MSEPELRVSADDRPRARTAGSGSRATLLLVLAAIIALAIGGYLFWRARSEPPPPPARAAAVATPAPKAAVEPPAIEHPVTAAPSPTPLPGLGDSDSLIAAALAKILGKPAFEQFFIPNELVRHIVATVDNLPRKHVAQRLVPLKAVPGPLQTTGNDASLAIAADNAARYAPYVRVFESVDSKKLAAAYAQLYPLFQLSYAELGYPTKYFNDRLFEAIDNMLAAPDITGPVALTQPKVLFEFADPALQELSAGQKMLVRMGPDNAARVKAKLRELRKALQGQ
ncbi:MAG: DUF3014 domain-containing protein [Casimicrobiaceae bacterium]